MCIRDSPFICQILNLFHFLFYLQEVPATAEPAQKPGKLLRCPQEGCGKVFRSSPGYRYHLKSHDIDPRPHVCHVCHKKFKSANGLKYHLRKAHHIEPVVSKQNATNNSGSNNVNNNNNNNTSKTNKNNNNNNNNSVNANSPKDESLSSEEDHLFNLAESFNSRGYINNNNNNTCLLYTSPSPRDATLSRMPSSA